MNMKKNTDGQAFVEYAILVFWIVNGLYLLINAFCTGFNNYLQNIYFILQLAVP